MANEALNQLRKQLDGETMRLVRQAIDIAVEESVEKPERQFAEHQARLVKAKADKAEWDVYIATEGQRVPSFVERDICNPIVEAPKSGGVLRPTSECGIPADGMVNVTVSFDVADGSLAGMRVELAPMPITAPGIAESLLADQRKKRDERREREAEERGFKKARLAVLREICVRKGDARTESEFWQLGMVQAFAKTMRMEG